MSPQFKNDWADAARRVAIKCIVTGNIIWLTLGLLSLSLVWKLSSSDLRDVLMGLVGWPWFGITGWGLFFITLLVGKWALKSQSRISAREIDRIAVVRNEAMQMRLELDMQSSKGKRPDTK